MLLFKVNLLILILMLNVSNTKAKCSVKKITKEVMTVLQRIQKDTFENLENMYLNTAGNLQSMYITTSENLLNMQNASSMNIIETLRWRDELSEIMTNMFNQTMNMITITGTNNGLATEIASLKQDINEIRNSTTNILYAQSNELSSIIDSLNATNIALTGFQNSTTYNLDNQSNELTSLKQSQNKTIHELEEITNITTNTFDIHSNELSSFKYSLNETNILLEVMTNRTTNTLDIHSTELFALKKSLNETNIVYEEIIDNTTNTLDIYANKLSSLKQSLNETNHFLETMRNSTTNTLDIHSNELSSLQIFLNETNNVLEDMRNTTEYMISILNNPSTEPIPSTPEPITSTPEPVSSTPEPVPSTPEPVPSGFTTYNGRVVLLPTALGGTQLNWQDSIARCSSHGATPFIPRSLEDFRYIQQVNAAITGSRGMWLPASDQVTEGTIIWYDGTSASSTLRLFDWNSGYAGDNQDGHDCVNIWTSYSNKLEFEGCSWSGAWSMVCEIV